MFGFLWIILIFVNMKESRSKLGISFFSDEINISELRLMDLFAMAQDIFDREGTRLENREVAKILKGMGKTKVEIIRDSEYVASMTARSFDSNR